MSLAMGNLDRPAPSPRDTPLEERVRPNDVIAGKYRVEAIIGSGGMGLVVSAKHVTMGSRVAIKLLRLDEETDPEGAVVRFVREARATARIESDHVVRVTDVAALPDGTPYMVMEYLEGRDLKHLILERDRIPVAEAVGYVLQACEGLAEAHASGVIHRDLKPSNLFLARRANGTTLVKVLDFGISKLLPRSGEDAGITTGSLMGSPLYMAPEQMRSSRDVDLRADVWSMGLILFELLAGEAPFSGTTIPEVCMNVMAADPPPITMFRDDVPVALQDVMSKAMAKERENRYATMGELARALEPFAEGRLRSHAERASAAVKSARGSNVVVELPPIEKTLRTPMAPPPPSSPIDVPRIEMPAATRLAAPEPTSRRWQRGVLIAVAVGLLLGVGGTIAARFGASDKSSSSSSGAPATAIVVSTPPVASAAPVPAASPSVEVTSVPFEALPVAKREPVRAAAPAPPRASAKGTAASAPSPAPAPAPSAGAKDDWKWGDRN